MQSPFQQRLLQCMCNIYSVMLLAYPPIFRHEYSREMAVVFRNRLRDVVQNNGSGALVRFMLHIGWDWLQTTLTQSIREHTMTKTTIVGPVYVPAVRWFAALPFALLSAYAALRIVVFFPPKDFHQVSIWAGIALFLMAVTFVSVGVWVAPNRKDSVARIAVSVVVFWGALLMAWSARSMAITPMYLGVCVLLGGVAGYLPWRRQHSQA
jgi:hypothetical protein